MPLQVMRKRPVQDRTVPLQTETTNARICTSEGAVGYNEVV